MTLSEALQMFCFGGITVLLAILFFYGNPPDDPDAHA